MYKLVRILFYTCLALMFAGVILGKYYGPVYCHIIYEYSGEFVLSLPGNDYKMFLKANNYDSCQTASQGLNHDIYVNIVSYLSGKSGVRLSPFLVVLYFDGHISDSSHYKASDIKGFSAYCLINGYYNHRLFVREGERFMEKPYFSHKVYFMMSSYPYLVMKNVLKLKKYSYIMLIDRQVAYPRHHKFVKDVLLEKLEKAGSINF
jgi:hypothetical protein